MAKSTINRTIEAMTIAAGQTATRTCVVVDECQDALVVGIQSPATLDAGTYVFQVSNDGSTWATLQDGGTLADVAVPAASKACINDALMAFKNWRISGPTAAADRTFLVTKQGTR